MDTVSSEFHYQEISHNKVHFNRQQQNPWNKDAARSVQRFLCYKGSFLLEFHTIVTFQTKYQSEQPPEGTQGSLNLLALCGTEEQMG